MASLVDRVVLFHDVEAEALGCSRDPDRDWAQCRAPLLTRQRAMGEGVDVEGGEVQGRVYEGVAEGRAPSGMSV